MFHETLFRDVMIAAEKIVIIPEQNNMLTRNLAITTNRVRHISS